MFGQREGERTEKGEWVTVTTCGWGSYWEKRKSFPHLEQLAWQIVTWHIIYTCVAKNQMVEFFDTTVRYQKRKQQKKWPQLNQKCRFENWKRRVNETTSLSIQSVQFVSEQPKEKNKQTYKRSQGHTRMEKQITLRAIKRPEHITACGWELIKDALMRRWAWRKHRLKPRCSTAAEDQRMPENGQKWKRGVRWGRLESVVVGLDVGMCLTVNHFLWGKAKAYGDQKRAEWGGGMSKSETSFDYFTQQMGKVCCKASKTAVYHAKRWYGRFKSR